MAPSNASTKKLAKVAKSTKGTSLREGSDRTFMMAIGAIILVGSLLVAYGRNERVSAQQTPPKLTDHFHAAYGVYNCDAFAAPLTDKNRDKVGIHTHEDGIIHIHPRSSIAAGERAVLGHFLEEVGLEVDGAKLTLTDKTVLESGKTTCPNGKPGVLVAAVWKNADDKEAAPEIVRDNIDDIRFVNDRMAITIAFVPEDEIPNIPRPESIPNLDTLTDVPSAPPPTSPLTQPSLPEDDQIVDETTTTAAGETTTTAAGGTATTAAGGTTTSAPR